MGVARLTDLPAEWSRQHQMLGLPAKLEHNGDAVRQGSRGNGCFQLVELGARKARPYLASDAFAIHYNRRHTRLESDAVRFAQYDEMVETFPSDRSDQSFRKTVLPRRAASDGFVTDAHSSHAACNHRAVDTIPITDQVAWSLVPRECLADLASNPLRRWDLW
jgi:hypothetical protein